MLSIYSSQTFQGQIQGVGSKSYIQRFLLTALLYKKQVKIYLSLPTYQIQDVQATLNILKACQSKIIYQDNYLSVDCTSISAPQLMIECFGSATAFRMSVFVLLYLFGEANYQVDNTLIKRRHTLFESLKTKYNFTYTVKQEKKQIKIKGTVDFVKGIIAQNLTYDSSQYLSGMMLVLPLISESGTEILIASGQQSLSYLQITVNVLKLFKIKYQETINGYKFEQKSTSDQLINYTPPIDMSALSFWLVANELGSQIVIPQLKEYQPDEMIFNFFQLQTNVLDFSQCPDLFPIMLIYCLGKKQQFKLINYERNTLKESNRVEAMVEQLKNLGANINVYEQELIIEKQHNLIGGKINCYNDHRITMSFAIYSLLIRDNISLDNPHSVVKSYPNFWDDFLKIGGQFA